MRNICEMCRQTPANDKTTLVKKPGQKAELKYVCNKCKKDYAVNKEKQAIIIPFPPKKYKK